MTTPSPASTSHMPATMVAIVVALLLAAALAGAWGFQILGDMAPCPLCLLQRWPYYLGIPLALVIAVAAHRQVPREVIFAGFVVLGLVLLWSTGLGIYHAGIEYKFWPGPTDCAAAPLPRLGAGDLLSAMRTTRVVSCDEAPWTLAGISLAGFNALISAVLATAVAMAAVRIRTMSR
jgi:disulfide bond formation protein DsbB